MASKDSFRLITFIRNKNFKGFSVFLAMAFLFLLLTKFSKSYTTQLQFNLEITGLNEEVVLMTDSVPQINITVQGRGFNLLPYMLYNPEPIILNAETDLVQNNANYVWNASENVESINKILSKSLKLVSVNPKQVRFEFDLRESKIVPVVVNSDIQFAPGHDILDQLKIDQDSVKVIGAVQDLINISKIETNTVVLTDVDSDINEIVNLMIPDSIDVEVIPDHINLKAMVKAYTEGMVEVPIEVTNVPVGISINIFPKTVEVYYAVNLDDYNTIKAKDFKVECNFDSIASEKQTFMVAEVTKKPENVKRVRLKQPRIEFVKL